MINIRAYENSDVIPSPREYPNTPWTHEVANGDKYNAAFQIAADDQEVADAYLWTLVGHSLRYNVVEVVEEGVVVGRRPLKWREAFEREREALAWIALAKDIGDFALYSVVNGERVERTKHRDHVWRLFGARLPERVAGRKDDILERAHVRRERAAKMRGESYWRRPPKQQPAPTGTAKQGTLF